MRGEDQKIHRNSFKQVENMIKRVSLIEIVDDRRVLIENHSGIMAYGDDLICIKTPRGIVRIAGKKLQIACMSREKIIISGSIKGVEL